MSREALSRRDALKLGLVTGAGLLLRPHAAAAATINPDSSPSRSNYEMRNPESPFLGDFIGNVVIIFNSLRKIQVAPLYTQNGPIYFHPIYNQSTANPENNWAGVEQHRPISFTNLDNQATDVFPTGIAGEVVIRGRRGGRVAYSIYQEERNQWEGGLPYPIEGPPPYNGQPPYNYDGSRYPHWWNRRPSWWNGQPTVSEPAKATYYFEGLGVGQPVSIVDPDSGRQIKWGYNSPPAVFNADSSSRLAVQLPHANGDVRVQLVFNVYPWQTVIARRKYSKTPELSLPIGVVKPGVPGAY